MYPSASLCREQETLQRDRAASASLQNVRIVAERAASAWCVEAVAAEKREARHERTREIAAQQAGKPIDVFHADEFGANANGDPTYD